MLSPPSFNGPFFPISDQLIHLDPTKYSKNEISSLLEMLSNSNPFIYSVIPSCDALLGITRFLEGYYLCCVTQCSSVCSIAGNIIYKVIDCHLIPITNMELLSLPRTHREEYFVNSFKVALTQQDIYFCYSHDLSVPFQHTILSCNIQSALLRQQSNIFLWNAHLLHLALSLSLNFTPWDPLNLKKISLEPWFVSTINGNITSFSFFADKKEYQVTLIARRSRFHAGARYHRRGTDKNGFVANEVETEQIIHCMDIELPKLPILDPCLYGLAKNGKLEFQNLIQNQIFCSFLQHRGSIPLLWSQDNPNMIPKPPITLLCDPFYNASAQHFNRLLEHYNSPIIVLNLIKTCEKTKREQILGDEYESCLEYLNQFIENEKIEYIHVDMSRESKLGHVTNLLNEISERVVEKVGFFATCIDHLQNNIGARFQTGIIRSNCIDCLDRTNAAAYFISRAALTKQMRYLGLLGSKQNLDLRTTEQLMHAFQIHGDAIAKQYGGSNLVNTIHSYSKADIISHSRDMIETVRRYYRNSFTDADKQNSFDIFLGVFRNWPAPVLLPETPLLFPPDYRKWRAKFIVTEIQKYSPEQSITFFEPLKIPFKRNLRKSNSAGFAKKPAISKWLSSEPSKSKKNNQKQQKITNQNYPTDEEEMITFYRNYVSIEELNCSAIESFFSHLDAELHVSEKNVLFYSQYLNLHQIKS